MVTKTTARTPGPSSAVSLRRAVPKLRIEAGQPIDWTLHQYGFLCATFPGLRPYTLHAGEPLTLRYRAILEDE